MLSLRTWLQHVAQRLPSRCEVCRAWPGRPVCDACIARFAQPRPRCRRCALPVPAGVAECGGCLREPPPLDACHAAVDYAYPWSGVIARFKFRSEAGWAGPLADLMRSAPWMEPALERADRVLPLPLAPARLAERGYNQAWLLARRLAPRKADAGMLLRVRDTPPQATLDRAARQRNMAHAFAIEPRHAPALAGAHIVLVDDVMTSGASLHSAAALLKRAGAAQVTALVLARTDDA